MNHKKTSSTDNDTFVFSSSNTQQEEFIVYDNVEFKIAPYIFMFEVPFLRCSKSINYAKISSPNWDDFKTKLKEIFSTDMLEDAKSVLLFIQLPQDIQNYEVKQLKESEIFSIEQTLSARFGKAFFFTTSFPKYCNPTFEARIMLCDNAPTVNDYIPEYHRSHGEPYDFLEISYNCDTPCQIIHSRFTCPRNELNKEKLSQLICNATSQSCQANSSTCKIVQLGLSESLSMEEFSIIMESFRSSHSIEFQVGIGALIKEDIIEANIYLLDNPSKPEF